MNTKPTFTLGTMVAPPFYSLFKNQHHEKWTAPGVSMKKKIRDILRQFIVTSGMLEKKRKTILVDIYQ